MKRIIDFLCFWLHLKQRMDIAHLKQHVAYRMYRQGFLYKDGRVEEAVPTWMVNIEKKD